MNDCPQCGAPKGCPHALKCPADSSEHVQCPHCGMTIFHGEAVKTASGVTVHSYCYPDMVSADPVDHPAHYTWLGGIEVIDITQHLDFCLGNVVKYVLRADHKGKPIEDLRKAAWYLEREIQRRTRED